VRPADLDIRHTIPERQTAARQRHEVVAKDAIADEPLGIRAAVGTEGSDAPAFDVGNVNTHGLAPFCHAARVGELLKRNICDRCAHSDDHRNASSKRPALQSDLQTGAHPVSGKRTSPDLAIAQACAKMLTTPR
jgi:hypothetical protein